MINPIPQTPSFRSGSRPNSIEPAKYPALEALRQHCYRDSITMLDRVYAEAQALHKRVTEAEARIKDLANELENAWAEADSLRDSANDYGIERDLL